MIAIAALLAGEGSDEAVVAAASEVALRSNARLIVVSVPRSVPWVVHFGVLSLVPLTAETARNDALEQAELAGRRATGSVPRQVPVEHLVVAGCPARALLRLAHDRQVARAVIPRGVIEGRWRARGRRLRRAGLELDPV